MRAAQFSLIAFVLALGYSIYQFTTQDGGNFGWQFRYLTIWGLTAAMVAHYLLWRSRTTGTAMTYHGFIAGTAVLNIMVMFLYWRLYFIDPRLVNGDNTPVWFQEYYLHLLGPLIIVFDALFLSQAFQRPLRGVMSIIVLCLAYIGWSEVLVGPMNDTPVGDVTSGLPYPFLNDMDMMGRAAFYGTTIATALVFFALSWGLCVLYRRYGRAA